jgi:predicted esterase
MYLCIMQEHAISIQKQMRYYSAGNATADTVLIAFHGYGQLAFYFMNKFAPIFHNHFVLTPEGTHRFYLNGTSGRVGASWMTKEWREQDILENNQNLETWLMSLKEEGLIRENQKIHILGFSQGGATAARFVQCTQLKIDTMTLWASVFPEDVVADLSSQKFQRMQKNFVLGTNDPYYSPEKQQEIIQFYRDLQFQIFTFEGGHVIEDEVLGQVIGQ